MGRTNWGEKEDGYAKDDECGYGSDFEGLCDFREGIGFDLGGRIRLCDVRGREIRTLKTRTFSCFLASSFTTSFICLIGRR